MKQKKYILWNYIMCCLITFHQSTAIGHKCPQMCQCKDKRDGFSVDCTAGNLTSLPADLDTRIVDLDLSLNRLSSLPDRAFSKLSRLTVLHLVTNNISRLSNDVFYGLTNLENLSLQGNRLRTVPREALRNLPSLKQLYLDNNEITTVPENSFDSLHYLINLRIDNNKLTEIPIVALSNTKNLLGLNFENNLIDTIPDYAFANLTNMEVLILSRNRLSRIGNKAFDGLQVLKLLFLIHNRLKEIPPALHALPDLIHLHMQSNLIRHLPDNCFAGNKKLSLIELKGNPIESFDNNTFSNMPFLESLVLSEVHDLTVFPNLEGTYRLKTITLDRASIEILPPTPCKNMRDLTVFDVHSNQISAVPNMTGCSMLTSLYLGNNEITTIDGSQFEGLSRLQDLILSFNKISYISDRAFIGLSDLRYLDLSFNRISAIHLDAFVVLNKLEDLNVAENQFEHLPTNGLQRLRYLKTFHNTKLQEPLDIEAFPNIVSLKLAYAYHCCAFIRKDESRDKNVMPKIKEEVITYLQYTDPPLDANLSEYENLNYQLYDDYNMTDMIDHIRNGSDDDNEGPFYMDVKPMVRFKPPIDCEPLPDPFRPCDDLFGWWSLRCGVWMVFLLAVIGNGTVLFVSITSKSKLDVTRFLICNLAMSDFCMGTYLGFLAVVDASTLGEFENHAIYWQTGAGCMVAGFLGVLSSELSVFTLVVITIERFYAISHAMQLGKRIRLGQAAIVMTCGWIVCIAIASLPLFKVSDFRKFAICLPFDTEDTFSLAYVCFIMIFNAISFIIIVACYAGMFVSIRASHTWNSKDTVVAKRMSLLVFTDFFCWAPIIFFSLTAAFKWDFVKISLDEAKVLTIFVLPLNSCANPFLYAFFTRQFKRDCVKLCKRIEESSITRHFSSSGVGRSSAISHRHLQNNSCTEKRRSCDNSVNDPSTSGEASSSNNPSYDSDLTVRKLPLTHEERQILRYMRTDGSVRLTSPRMLSPLELSSPEVEQMVDFRRRLNIEPKMVKLSPRRRPEIESESMHDIVLHTKEGNVYLSAKPTSVKNFRRRERFTKSLGNDKCAQRLSNYALKPLEHGKSPSTDIRSVQSQTAETNIDSQPSSTPTDPVNGEPVVEDKARRKFEADRSKELGLKIQPSFKTKSKQSKLISEECSPQKTVSTQTEMLLPLRRPWQSEIAANISKREKDKHINEWRKTSHLSFLWRNSGNFDALHQKQKSNSLVELTRPLSNWQNSTNKRHSLTSKHEGYILLRNSSRDSAYGDDELYEFYDNSIQEVTRPKPPKVNKKRQKNIKHCSDMNNSSDSDGLCETDGLLMHSDSKVTDNLSIPKGRNSCDIESGISSSS